MQQFSFTRRIRLVVCGTRARWHVSIICQNLQDASRSHANRRDAPANTTSKRTEQMMFLYKCDCYNHSPPRQHNFCSRAALGRSQHQLICLKPACTPGMWLYAMLPIRNSLKAEPVLRPSNFVLSNKVKPCVWKRFSKYVCSYVYVVRPT